jgi:hypothetical protein
MMNTATSPEMAGLQRKLLLTAILDFPGMILIGLAIYGKDSNGNAFHPLLNDSTVTTLMLVVGIPVVVWGAFRTFSLIKRMQALQPELKGK